MTSEPSCRRFSSISDDNAGDDPSAEPLTPWPGGGAFAPTLPLQRISAPVFTLWTVVTVGPVTLSEPSIFPEPHPAAKPPTRARARIAQLLARPLVIESVDALEDLGADSWREPRVGAHLDEAGPSKHLRRAAIVIRHATVQRPGRLDREECTEGL